MNGVQGLPYTLPDFLSIALEKLDDGDLIAAFQFADRACRFSGFSDANALLVRATVLSKRGYLTEAIHDLYAASLMMHGNHNIACSLLRLCFSDLKNHSKIFNQSLVSLLRQASKTSLNPEVATWLAGSGLSVMGAAWREGEFVSGWAINTNEPSADLLIELDAGFFPVATGMPTPWLAAAGIGNGYNGFRLKLPDSFSLLRIGMSGSSLWGCPFVGNINHEILYSPQQLHTSNTVDIIVPVYSGYADTLACLDSIKASSNSVPYRVLVVDDCTPDAQLRNALRERAQRKEITLISRPINAGFSGAVNTGLSLDNSRDVVLLNADTLVFGNWLDRLHAAAYQSDDIATVTPLSNHGELLSYPLAMHENPVLNAKHAELIDQLFKSIGPIEAVNIPVGVGFCFYIKRQALNEVGPFDEGAFGRGYGEDTDFCVRIQQAGWRNVCAANTYVVHWGSRSFGAEKQHLVAQNLHRLLVRYPNHSDEYDKFLDDDLLYELRRNAQRLWLAQIAPQYKGSLKMSTSEPEEALTFTLKPIEKRPGQWQVKLKITGITGLNTITYTWPEQSSELREDIRAAGFESLELNTLGEWPTEIIDQLTDGFISYNLNLEDYSGYCPRKYRLIHNAKMCDDPDTSVCAKCVAELGPLVYGYTDIVAWQDRALNIFSKANRISVLNDDLRKAYLRRFPILSKVMTTNKTALKSPPIMQLPIKSATPLRIAVLSARSLEEGYLQLLEQAKDSYKQKLDIEFIVLGPTLNDANLQYLPNIQLVGEVAQSKIQEVLRLHECSAIANFSPCVHIKSKVAKSALQFNLP